MATTKNSSRGREATRAAILEAARQHFMASSYEQVGMRAIAATAGVNLALINRYFGSKENLFLETMQGPTMESLFGDDPTRMAEHAARFAAEYQAAGPAQEQLLALLRSCQNETAARVLRDNIRQHGRPLAEALGGEEGELRAEMALAVLLGIGIFQRILHTDRLGGSSPEQLERMLVPVLRACLSGT